MKKYNGHKISLVMPGSIAEELNIEPGDVLLKINDEIIEDIFDFQYMVHESSFMLINKPEKPFIRPPGLIFLL